MRLLASGAEIVKIRITAHNLQLTTDDSYDNAANKCINLLIAHFMSFRSLCVTVLRADLGKLCFWLVPDVLLKMDYGFLS